MRFGKIISQSQFFCKPVYHCSFFETCFYWSTGIVASKVFPPFVADGGCVYCPQQDDTYGT